MQPFLTLQAIAVPLPLANVDTDQIIPARFMQRSRAEGYGNVLFHDMRSGPRAAPDAFPLDQPCFGGAQVLVARRNFGCGSSREAAVYALLDAGIRCVLAPSFGDIFAANAVNNGLLPGRLEEEAAETLLNELQHEAQAVTVNLDTRRVSLASGSFALTIDRVWRKKLMNGWDDTDLTLERRPEIDAFVARDRERRPWATPRRPTEPTSPADGGGK